MVRGTILIVEDDAAIRRGVGDALRFAGYEVLQAATGRAGMELGIQGNWDLMLLDLLLPGPGGLEILAEVRAVRSSAPVIILTARGEESDRVKGLEMGADDYVVKPFSVRELLARVDAVLRRSAERPGDIGHMEIPGGLVDFERREVRFTDGGRAELSERETELLRFLAANAGRAISRDEILAKLWRLNSRYTTTRTIDMHVVRLRSKLRDDPEAPRVLFTVRGKGYMYGEGEASGPGPGA